MNIMKRKHVQAIFFVALLCSTVVPAQGTFFSSIKSIPASFKLISAKMHNFVWEKGIKPVWQNFIVSDFYQDLKWGAVGAGAGSVYGVASNVGRSANFFNIITDMLAGSVVGGLFGFGGKRIKRLADKNNKDLDEVNGLLNGVNKGLNEANVKNKEISDKLVVVNKKNGQLGVQFMATKFMLDLAWKTQQRTSLKLDEEKKKMGGLLGTIEKQQKENQHKIGLETKKIEDIAKRLGTSKQITHLTNMVTVYNNPLQKGSKAFSTVVQKYSRERESDF